MLAPRTGENKLNTLPGLQTDSGRHITTEVDESENLKPPPLPHIATTANRPDESSKQKPYLSL